MTYSPNIPQAADNPSQSQPLISANFQQLNTQFGTNLATGASGDHVLFTASSGNGKHERVTLLDQSGAIAAVKQAAINQVLIYGKTVSGVTMPYYTRDNIALATTEFPLAPIKAYASFTTLGAGGNITPSDSFNINNPIVQTGTNLWNFTLTNACRTTTYGVLAFFDETANVATIQKTGYAIISSSNFTITITTIGALVNPFKFTAIVLET